MTEVSSRVAMAWRDGFKFFHTTGHESPIFFNHRRFGGSCPKASSVLCCCCRVLGTAVPTIYSDVVLRKRGQMLCFY